MRISLTEACNFRCQYCLPDGYRSKGLQEFLSPNEVENLVQAFAEMGTVKIRLTGGEPTLRQDLVEIVERVSSVPGIQQVGISTNGYNLEKIAPTLKTAGIQQVNVSVDSLNPARFTLRTGRNLLDQVLRGIETSLALGFASVKLNTVLMRESFDEDLALFQDWIHERPVAVRFIELMPTQGNSALFRDQHLKSDALETSLLAQGWREKPRGMSDGPAKEFTHADFKGRIGIIAPYAKHFCSSCNRLRITSRGGLRLCLFGEGDHSIRPYLQSRSERGELQNFVRAILTKKEVSHYLPDGRMGDNWSFSAMGG